MDRGNIILDGNDITKLPEYKRARYMGRVFQDPLKGTAFDMTIEENLAIAAAKNKPRACSRGSQRLTGRLSAKGLWYWVWALRTR